MKNHTIAQVAALSLFIAAAADVSANTYLNLKPNDNIAYGNAAGRRIVTTVSASGSTGWNKYADFLNGGDKFVWTSSTSEAIYLFNDQTLLAEKMVNFADPIGTKYTFSLGDCTNGGTLAQKGLTIATPAGVYHNVVRMTFNAKCNDGGLGEAWFAPQVGLIKWNEDSLKGPVTYQATDGKIGGKVFGVVPVQTALSSNPSFPLSQFTISATPVQAGANLTLTNTSNLDMVLRFNSGQEFEISLLNSANQVINTWSKNIRFVQGIHDVTIPAGKSRSFGGTLAMTNFDGKALAAGDYTLRVEVKAASVSVAGQTAQTVSAGNLRADSVVTAVRGN